MENNKPKPKSKRNKINPPFTKGCHIRKKSFGLYNYRGLEVPTMQVQSAFIEPSKKSNKIFRINGRYITSLDHIVIITSEEAERLQQLRKNLTLSEPISLSEEETCYTNYKGTKTAKIKEPSMKRIMESLYLFTVKRPDENFQAYLCPNCKFYHIGRIDKTKQYKTITWWDKLIHKFKRFFK